jgi:hypothetical protein
VVLCSSRRGRREGYPEYPSLDYTLAFKLNKGKSRCNKWDLSPVK